MESKTLKLKVDTTYKRGIYIKTFCTFVFPETLVIPSVSYTDMRLLIQKDTQQERTEQWQHTHSAQGTGTFLYHLSDVFP